MSAHLAECRECHDAYRRLQQVLMSVDEAALAAPELPDGFERTVWARLEPSLAARPRRLVRRGCSRRLPRLGWAAAALVIVVGAFYAGRLSPRRAAGAARHAAVAAQPNQVRERILLVDLGDHLDRSQRVLVELVSADGAGAGTSPASGTAPSSSCRPTGSIAQTAAATGDASVVELLDQLERVLVDVAASPSDLVGRARWTTSGGGSSPAACSSRCAWCLRICRSGGKPRCGRRASVRRSDSCIIEECS